MATAHIRTPASPFRIRLATGLSRCTGSASGSAPGPLSSHLLDEVERTCDAVAIVDHGKVIRQGPIGELTGAAGVAVEVRCSDPPAAVRALGRGTIASGIAVSEDGLTVTLVAGSAREQAAEINRRLVEAGISVYGLRQTHTSLEDWFLSVTSRLGEEQ